MILEKNPLIKRTSRSYYHFVTVRRIVVVIVVFLLCVFAMYNYCSISGEQITEYEVILRSHLGKKETEGTVPSPDSSHIVLTTIHYEQKGEELLETEFLRRREHVRAKCQELGLMGRRNYTPMPNAKEFLINYDYHLIHCSVAEAASTSWMYNMNLLAGFTPEYLKRAFQVSAPTTVARRKYARPLQSELLKALDNNLSFLIARHPFARLVSSYVRKFVMSDDIKFYELIGSKIIRKTRLRVDISIQASNGRINQTEFPPRFEELVRFILCEWRDNQLQDEQWKPMTKFCTPCQVAFDYIIKFETIEQEQEVLIQRANLQDILKPRWEDHLPSKNIQDLEKEYFSQLSKGQIRELYEYYKADFELFEYSIDKYLAYGQDMPLVSLPCVPPPQPLGN